ncbi:MAG: CoA transferase [Chloroflexi bacterium]|nr:CoA transferase [Chloroflexota bacterium]
MSTGPLAGVRIFDLTAWMVGPWCSSQLGALGAEVIHIEQPDVDWSTLGAGVPPLINGTSIGYIAWNMNKRGLSLAMKSPEDRAVAYELLKTSDVFLINMRPGVADRLGVGYDVVSEINPQIVYCAITGWGESGPMALLPGADTPAQYVTGFSTGTGTLESDDELNRHFTQMDATTGNYAAQAILMGLVARKRTGKGQRIHVSMLKAGSALQSVRIAEYLASGQQPQRLGSASQNTAPHRAYLCADGQFLGVSVTSDDEWCGLCELIGQPELAADPRFAANADRVDHREELDGLLEPVFRGMVRDYWLMHLDRAGVPVGYPMTWAELRHHAQVLENDYIGSVETAAWGRVWMGGPPWHLSKRPARMFSPPMPGEHSQEILADLQQQRGASEQPAGAPAAREA